MLKVIVELCKYIQDQLIVDNGIEKWHIYCTHPTASLSCKGDV